MEYLCLSFGKSRQAYYDSNLRKEERQMTEVLVLTKVKEVRKDHKKILPKKLH
jgi:hypothetical protein